MSYIPPANQIDETFIRGYTPRNRTKYHNVGQLKTPYLGKKPNVSGDYGPVQDTVYYTSFNRTYPYPLDKDARPSMYLPTEGCMFENPGYFQAYNPNTPWVYIPENYYTPCSNSSTISKHNSNSRPSVRKIPEHPL